MTISLSAFLMVETFVPTYEMKFSMLSVILGSSFTLGRYLEAKVHPEGRSPWQSPTHLSPTHCPRAWVPRYLIVTYWSS